MSITPKALLDKPAVPLTRARYDKLLRKAIKYGDLQTRDEWLHGVLADTELSPAARMVGAYLGLALDFDDWPTVHLRAIGGHLRVVGTRLGLPLAIVAKACNALVARGWLSLWIGQDGHLRGFDLGPGGWS
jgi:hypothetical protein